MSADPTLIAVPFEDAEEEGEITPTLEELLDRAIGAAVAQIRVCLPGYVTAYDPATCMATVQPVLRDSYADGTTSKLPALPGVPVRWDAGQGYSVTVPLGVGDEVMITICDRSILDWLATGGPANRDITPTDKRRHALGGAWCEPGVEPRGQVSAASYTDRAHFGNATVNLQITNGNKIKLGGAGVDVLDVLSSTLGQISALLTALTAFATALGGATDPVVTAAAAALGTALSPITSAISGLKSAIDALKV